MKHRNRLLPLILLLVTLMLASVVATIFWVTAEDDNIASDNPVTLKAFDTAELASHSARQFTEGTPIGIRMGFGAPFNKFTLCMPTWGDKTVCLTLSLYKWDTDFDTTRSAAPVATRKVENHPDNGHASLEFDEQPAGEYLICIDEFSGGRLGAWQMSSSVSNAYTYESGVEKAASWEISVSFTKTPVEAFRKIDSAKDAIDGKHTPPAESTPAADALVNTHKVMPDTWVFTDALGRESLTYEDVGGVKEDKTVAMFYWTWHVDLAFNEAFNVNDFILKYPEAIRDYDHEAWPTGGVAYFWNEPLYGYYRTNDTWVLRRHAELLANAGVDTIFTDNTNGNYTWKSSYTPLYETWSDALENGAVNVPKVSFLLPFGPNSGSLEQIEMLYLDIYRTGKYQNLWFYWDEKPMLMGFNNNVNDGSNLHKEIQNFFTWRAGQAAYEIKGRQIGNWGWLATYPQIPYYKDRDAYKDKTVEQTTVGVAVNHSYITHDCTAMNKGEDIIGRSFTSTFKDRFIKEGTEASLQGYCFSEQFDYALELDPKVIFITGWNEWTAGRHESWGGVENAFPDQFNDEYSRDLEMTKGALGDNYYYLLVNYVRKYKGVNPIPTPSLSQTIDLTAGADQWNTAEPYYAAYIGNTADRDAKGYGSLVYTETSGRNDIIGARVARDAETVWFYVECNENITPYTDTLWMTLYIDSDQESKGWETFDYVVNKSAASADTLVLEKFTGNGYDTEKVADVRYKVDGKFMMVEIPKSALGLAGNDYTINFAWTDNVHDEGDYSKFSGDIMDFYLSGDVAPGARFKFSYVSTHENTTGEVETEPATEEITEPTTEPVTEAPTNAPIETPAPETRDDEIPEPGVSKGCGSVIAVLPVMLTLLGGVLLKKKEQEL
ncbi:MAG: hypothetical protein IJX72_05265 [Clostridia bacterium]|nr:hypothetical protein [Clostridia bacterium]